VDIAADESDAQWQRRHHRPPFGCALATLRAAWRAFSSASIPSVVSNGQNKWQ
jgi:hypothetical protein